MTTALDLISRSLRMLGVYAAGENPSAEESQDSLSVLNALLAEASNGAMVSVKTLDTIALSANVSSITVGPSGTTITARPVNVLPDSYIDIAGTSYQLELFDLQNYSSIGNKGDIGIPQGIFVLPNMPNVSVTLWPVPSQAMTLNLWSDKLVASFPTLTTVMGLPPGYENALANMLAVEVAPEYEVQPPPAVLAAAARGRRVLKRSNVQVPKLALDVPGLNGVADWRAGG
jgi:hypothetical protein